MKLLLFLIVVLFGLWLWRRSRAQAGAGVGVGDTPETPRPSPTATEIPNMVRCLHCQMHLPPDEAVMGALGPYCTVSHRTTAGDRAP